MRRKFFYLLLTEFLVHRHRIERHYLHVNARPRDFDRCVVGELAKDSVHFRIYREIEGT